MKKLFNSRFLFILAASIVVLILLTLGAFYLFDDNDNTFIKSGYVLNPLSSKSEKYFFDEKVGYKENLSSMIEFVDVDKNTVSILKDSFLHYSDDSMSFLKKGALLDLNSIKGDSAVAFYNISSESVIEKKDEGYYIASSNGDIKLTNFMGRISDDKYIVVGDLNLKMSGNNTIVKGDYFEIVYIEEGIVNIENKDVKFQVASEDAVISVGTRLQIDLGNKKIIYDGQDVMSITAITIDGDENIEIIPKVEDEEEEEPQGGGSGNGSGAGTGEGNGTGSGSGNENPGSNMGENADPVDNILINLKDAKIGSTDIDVIFEVLNATEKDSFKLQVVNLASGRTVDIVASVETDEQIQVSRLTPGTKYLFTVVNEKDNSKYFQKVLETKGFGIKLEKEYATNTSLSYNIIIDDDADVSNARLTLYKYNEETKENEIAKSCYTDTATQTEVCHEKQADLSSYLGNVAGIRNITFDGLESDTIYTAVLDEFLIAPYNYQDIYNITLTSMTLKELPTFTEMEIERNVGTGSFDLSLGNIKDPDNAITSYTYMIYEMATNELAIPAIVHKNASPLNVLIGEGEDKLKNDTNYYYKVVIEYYDNEKYIEYVTTDSMVFVMGDDPYVTVTPRPNMITHETIGATVTLLDNSCLISMPGRDKCNGENTAIIEISKVNSLTGERIPYTTIPADFVISDGELKYELYLENLQPGTVYNVEVRARLNNSGSLDTQEILHTDESKRTISTKYLSSFNANWENFSSNAEHVVNTSVLFSTYPGVNTETPEETFSKMDKIVLKLYQGERPADFSTVTPISTIEITKDSNINFKEKFYDMSYGISSKTTFGFDIDQLKLLNSQDENDEGKLSEYYTLYIEAYADGYPVTIINPSHEYRISPVLLLDGIADPVIKLNPISNVGAGNIFDRLTNTGTVVGLNVVSSFDIVNLIKGGNTVKTISYYVYDMNNNQLQFYVLEDGELKLTSKLEFDLDDTGYHETNIYMGYGTDYETIDTIMSRGNEFKIGYEISIVTANGESDIYPQIKGSKAPNGRGLYTSIKVEKENPSVKMYMSKSTADSVLYKYEIKDPDNALYKEAADEEYSMLYTINDGRVIKYPLVPVEGASYKQFSGEIEITGLKRNDTYKIYYKKNVAKSNNLEVDVTDYLENYSNGEKVFEGYYSPAAVKRDFNFAYEIINRQNANDEHKDNKIGIKILASESMLDRILHYQLTFTAKYADGTVVKNSKGKDAKLVKEIWQLSACPDKTMRCIYVDYTELKNEGMKSEWVKDEDGKDQKIEKIISLSIIGYYDNGLAGYDYKVGSISGYDYTIGDYQESSGSDYDYPYMIMQDDLFRNKETGKITGSYITFNGKNGVYDVGVWTDKTNGPKGYYSYSFLGSRITLTPHHLTASSMSVSFSLNMSGYSSKHGYMTPKMISILEMEAQNGATFSFDTITPTISVDRKSNLMNGFVLKFSLGGLDLSEIKEDNNGYNLYVDTWSEESYNKAKKDEFGSVKCEGSCAFTGIVRPTVAVPINKDNPLAEIETVIDNLSPYDENNKSAKYYFQVYIKQKNSNSSGFTYTQLYDSALSSGTENKTKPYDFTISTGGVFKSVSLGLKNSDEFYGNRYLNTSINLDTYGGGLPYNFGVMYVVCSEEQANAKKCGIVTGNENEETTNILQKLVEQKDVQKNISDLFDITEYDDIIYGTNYYVYVYAVADYYSDYQNNANTIKDQVNIRLNVYDGYEQFLRKLSVPTLEVTREAGYENGQYYIDFTTSASDPDRTLRVENADGSIVTGVYKIKLTVSGDAEGENLLGPADSCTICLQQMNADGIYENISPDTLFDVLDESNKKLYQKLRIVGLEADSSYNFRIESSVDINNIKEEHRFYNITRDYTVYTSNEFGVSFGNVLFNVTKNSFIVTFFGGTVGEIKDNVLKETNITGLEYTIQEVDSISTAQVLSGEYIVSTTSTGPNIKNILIDKNSGEPYFVIDPLGVNNKLGSSYSIAIVMILEDNSGNEHRIGLNGTVVYVEG